MLITGGNVYDYDFSDTPNLPYYKFQDNMKIPDPKGQFIEIPVKTYQHNPLYTLLKILLSQYTTDRISGNGKGIYIKTNTYRNTILRWLRLSRTLFSLDNANNIFFKFILLSHF